MRSTSPSPAAAGSALMPLLALALLSALSLATLSPAGAQALPPEAAAAAEAAGPFADERDIGVLLQSAGEAYRSKDYGTMRQALARAVALRPHVADLRFALARADALLDRKTEAYNNLVLLDKQGLSFDMEGDPDFENLRSFQLYDFLQEKFAQNAEPYGGGVRAFTIDRRDLLIESLAWDPRGERLFAGSVTTGTVFEVAEDGSLETLLAPDAGNGLLGITALAVDAERGFLWVASGATPQARHVTPEQRGLTTLHRIDLESGRQTARFPAPARPMLFVDIAVATDGSVFLADAVKPVVWTLSAATAAGDGAGELEPFFAGRGLTGIRSITLDDTGRYLYLADYERGLFGIGLEARKLFSIHLGDALNLGGIDVVQWYEDSLLLIQNGNRPLRILRLQLFADRIRARHVQALESAHPEFRNPVAATPAGSGRYLVIANSHRNAYDPRSGEPRPGAPREPHLVLAIDPAFNWSPPEEL